MSSELLSDVLSHIRHNWACSNDLEVTFEANPSSVEAAKFRDFKDAGVNRVSIGVQALNNSDLKALGRLHSVEEALDALDIAASTFDRFSFDLIYARQGQTLDDWSAELEQALSFQPTHLSLYQLTIEDGTAFGALQKASRLRDLPSEDLSADLFELTQSMTADAGLQAYEISNHGRAGHEARHNQIYWNGGDWLGIGPGAHGRLTYDGVRWASTTPLLPSDWLTRVFAEGATGFQPISNKEWALEYLLMSLRTRDGTDLEHLSSIDPRLYETIHHNVSDSALPVAISEQRLQLSAGGRILLDAVLDQLVRDRA